MSGYSFQTAGNTNQSVQYSIGEELPAIRLWWLDDQDSLIDFSHGWSFSATIIKGGVTYVNKTSGIAGYAGSGQSSGLPHLDASSPSSVLTATWYYLAATLSGTTLTLYVNGASVSSDSSTAGSRYTGSIPVHVGRYNSTWPTPKFNGRLAYAALYGSVLSPEQIAARAAFA